MISFPLGELEDWERPFPTESTDCCASCQYGFVSRNVGGARALCRSYVMSQSGEEVKTFYICKNFKRNESPEEW
jgi:hypothetical protein